MWGRIWRNHELAGGKGYRMKMSERAHLAAAKFAPVKECYARLQSKLDAAVVAQRGPTLVTIKKIERAGKLLREIEKSL